jgi:2-dehydropantoate 2-reductase
MNITIYGLGAVGGLLGARLALAGNRVSAIARGATLAAVQQHGLRLDDGNTLQVAAVDAVAVADAGTLGVQDLVVVAVKAPQLGAVAAGIAALIGPETLVMTAMNGVPWWFFDDPKRPMAGLHLPALANAAPMRAHIPLQRTLGCVVHLAAACPEPGVVRLTFGNRLLVGAASMLGNDSADNPAGDTRRATPAAAAVAATLQAAGFDAVASTDIHTDIWYKLWGNMTLNPVSVLAGAGSQRVLDDALVRAFCLAAMAEAAAIGARIGCPITQTGAERLDVARQLGNFKTSMLQDAEAGRPLEIDALVTVVHEIGVAAGVPTPHIDSLLGLIRLHAQSRGLYPL